MPELKLDLFIPMLNKANDLIAMLKYFAFVIVEGDWANDWLLHVDPGLARHLVHVGKALAESLGF